MAHEKASEQMAHEKANKQMAREKGFPLSIAYLIVVTNSSSSIAFE